MKTILKRLPTLASLGALIVIAACNTDSTAPTASVDPAATLSPALPSVVASEAVVAEQVDAPSVSAHGTYAMSYPAGASTFQFTHNPTLDGAYIIGMHMVSFPRYTICDPSRSSYGEAFWKSDCTKLTTPITITAVTWKDALGRPQIDFQNAIRFVPNYYGQMPAIYLRDPSASLSSFSRIDYCGANGSCVDEAATDSLLVTRREAVTGYLFRFIRHFSGYNVWA